MLQVADGELSSGSAEKLKQLARECQDEIVTRRLSARVRTRYKRAAYQHATDNAVRGKQALAARLPCSSFCFHGSRCPRGIPAFQLPRLFTCRACSSASAFSHLSVTCRCA